MKNYKQLFIVSVLSLFLFTGCFEFVEEISFNKDGSGSATLTINLSRSKTKLASIMLLDSIHGYKVPSKATIREHLAKAVEKIKATKGISNVQETLDFDEYIVSISCDFEHVEALNNVLINFSTKQEAQKIKNNKHFSYNPQKKEFIRSHHFDIGKEFKKTKQDDRKIVETASFTGVYRFAEPVESFSNTKAKLSKSKKAIMLRLNAQDIISNKETIKNNIQLHN